MAAPSYIGNGGIADSDNSATVAVPFPSLQANDILLLQLLSAGGTDTHQQPTDFTSIGTIDQGTNQTSSWWWKRAAGTESGNLTCSRTNSGDAFFGVMSCWRGAVTTGTPFNYAGPLSDYTKYPLSSAITPTYDAARVICLINEEDNLAIGTLDGGNYAADFDVASGTGDDAEFAANSFAQTTAAEEPQRTSTLGGGAGDSWATITLALWSLASSPTTISATKGAATGTSYAATVQALAATTVTATKGAATGTSYASAVQASVDTTVNVGEGGTGKNLLENPSFEAGITGWTSAYSATLSQSTTQAWNGSNSLRVQSGSNWSGGKSPLTSTTESTQYTLSFYIYPVDGSMPFYMDLRDQGSVVFDDLTMGTKTAGTWTRVTKTFTTSAGDTGVYVTVRKNDYAGTDYFYLDGFQIELGASATDWEDYGATGGPDAIAATSYDAALNIGTKANATKGTATGTGHNPTVLAEAATVVSCTLGTATGTSYAATVQTAANVTISATAGVATGTGYDAAVQANVDTTISVGGGGTGKNLWVNPSFESGVTGWTGLGYEEVVAQSTDQEWVGTYSLKLTPVDPGNYNGLKSDTRSVVSEATQYTLSFYIYPASNSITYTSTVYNQGDGFEGNESTTYAADQWSRVDITFTTDAGTTGVYLQISQGNVASVVPWYIDGVQLELGASATAWEDYGAGGGPDAITASQFNAAINVGTVVNATAGAATGTAYAADVSAAADSTVTATKGAATATGYAATVQADVDTAVGCTKGTATGTPHAAVVSTAAGINVDLAPATATGYSASIQADVDATISATKGAATGTGYDTTILGVPLVISATKGAATATGYDPAVGGASYFVRADGSASKVNAIGPRTSAAACMSVATHNSSTFNPGDQIYICDDGGDYASELETPSSGSAGVPITYTALGTPVFDGANDLTGASYKWTASGSGTNEFYCEAAAGGTPSLTEPTSLWLNESTWAIEGSALGSLTDHQWKWGNNDTLGYNTVYIRDDTGDPDTSGITIDAPQRAPILVNGKSYVTIDGLTVLYSNGDWIAGIRVLGGSNVTIQNCTVKYSGNGIALEGTDYGTVDGCTVDTNITHGINIHGEDNDTVTGCEVKNSVSANTIQTVVTAGIENGYGIKYMFITNSSIHNCEVYGNDFNGIDLDGGDISAATYCDVYENKIYNNGSDGILVEIGSSNNKLYRNIIYNNAETQDGAAQIRLWDKAQNNEIYGNVIYLTNAEAAGTRMIWIGSWDDARSSSGTKIYNNTIDGGGISTQGIYLAGNATPSNTLVKNNIVANMASGAYFITGSDFTGMTFDYNCIEAAGNLIFYNAGWASWATWQALPQDTHSYNTDPLFKDAANGKFYLTSSSPCIDVGTDLGATYDDGIDPHILGAGWPDALETLDQDSWGTGWEIGAYVYDYADAAVATATAYAATIGAGSLTVAATKGAATATGNSATVTALADVTVTATAGAATATGYAATVEADVDTTIPATAGTATATGYDIGLAADLVIPCTSDAVVGAGYDASISTESGIAVSCGSLTGSALAATVTALADTTVTASSGTATGTAYAATVQADVDVAITATLGTATATDYAAVVNVGTGITATAGTATATGYDIAIAADNSITATLGTATGTANAADVILGAFVPVDVAAATVTGYNPTVLAALAIPATAGTATATGYDATVAADLVVPVTLGVVTVTGYAAGLDANTVVMATVANAVAAALNPGISGITSIGATKATATATGYAADVGADVTITATLGSAALTALDALLAADVTTVATKGTVTVTGCNPAILLPIDITATLGTATATANAATVNVGTGVGADAAAATATAHNPTVYAPLGIDQTSTPAITVTGLDPTVFEGIINITCGTIAVTIKTPTVTIPFRFLISPTITSSTISYTTTSSSIDYSIEELA